MIAGIFHTGSGLGNQLHRYVFVRTLALDKGFDFGMQNPENFKGSAFMNLDMGKPVENLQYTYTEPRILHTDNITDVRTYDFDGISNILDNTLIDGEFQGEKYFEHRKDEIRQWLAVESLTLPDNLCVINFRGGEYITNKDLFLNQEYWDAAIKKMKGINQNIQFQVVTDDPYTAKKFFPHFPISHNIAIDWRMIRYAPYLILSNSSFAILPALLNENVKEIIAPKYWARHNAGFWALPYNEYRNWTYI